MGKLKYYGLLWKYIKLLVFKRETLGRMSVAMAKKRSAATFLLFENDQISFADFNANANRRAHTLAQLGVKRGEVVSLLMENRPEFLESLVALSKLGAAAAALNSNQRGKSLVHSLKLAGGSRIILGAECIPTFQTAQAEEACIAPENILVDTRWQSATLLKGSRDFNALISEADGAELPDPGINSQDLFMLIYTSGTTGLPKAATINHLRLYSAGIALGWYGMGVGAKDTIYCALPLYHSNGALIAFGSALANGAALALSRRFSTSRFWEEASGFGATCFIYIGEVLRYLVNAPPSAHDRAHRITRVLGNGLRADIWTAFQERFGISQIREFYSSTEGNAHTLNLEDVVGSTGKILLKASNNLFLVRYDVEKDEYLRNAQGFCLPCPPGEVGALLGKIKSTTPFYGYTNAEESKKKLMHDVFKKGDSFFCTGDLLKADEAGNYYFVDRIGDTFRWKGENVSTQEVAEVICNFPGIAFANVYGVDVPGSEGRAGMAAITMEADQSFDSKTFHSYTAQRLPEYAQPAFLRIINDLEVTGTFKMTKNALKSAGYDPAQVSDPLYLREQSSYVALDKNGFARIQKGQVRF